MAVDRLHRILSRCGRDVVQKLLASGTDILRDFGLDRSRADALANVLGGFGNAGAKLLDGVRQARARLLGLSFDLLQRTVIGVRHGPVPSGYSSRVEPAIAALVPLRGLLIPEDGFRQWSRLGRDRRAPVRG